MLEALLAVMAEALYSDHHYLRGVSCSINNTKTSNGVIQVSLNRS